MKIVVLSVFSPFRGGISQFNTAMCLELETIGHEVHRINFTTQYPKLLFPGKTQYAETPEQDELASERSLSSINPLTWIKTRKKIKELKPELVITPYWTSYLAPALTFTIGIKGTNSRHLGLIHNAIPHEPKIWDSFFIRRFLKQVDRTLCLSVSVANQLKELPCSPPNLTLTHPVYSHFGKEKSVAESRDFLNNLGLDPRKKTLLFFGLIREYKGLKVLIEAFGQLDDSFQLIIAGECYEREQEYMDAINSNPLSKNIIMVNEFVNDEQVPDYFSAADAVILPYLNATQSGVTAIALHFNTPVIASKVGGLN